MYISNSMPHAFLLKLRRLVDLLFISDNLLLIQSASVGEGKTQNMAKGLFLCQQKDLFAGESAGFGLPVVKTKQQTIFPSIVSTRQKSGIIEIIYNLNLINTWRIAGIAAPLVVSHFMEKLVDLYMRRPAFQPTGLSIRDMLFKFFKIRSTMKPGKSLGYCRVLYQTNNLQLEISVNGQSLGKHDQLILLNEVDGVDFTRMIPENRNREKVLDGKDFLPWQMCAIDTIVENPGLGIGFFLSLPDNQRVSCFEVAAGREVGRDLDWAGLSIASSQKIFSYFVNFYQSDSTLPSEKMRHRVSVI